ncbi:protein trichome birefringence-like 43 [Salvia splendens]|uniref:protein trichome birefringence-like 43 n=1 Tax=Salvia splendens TaxID=180675 RepID=UPI001C25B1AB|nr:protein trichome birefringence-like 43 [Salvia splendens]
MMFVGDSLSLNQWQSLSCMLHVLVPHAKYTTKTVQGLSTFTFHDYDVSLKFYRNAFLVDIKNEERGRVLMLDSLSSSQIWEGMDYVIFDSWHWWLHSGRKQPWDWVVYGNTTVKDLDRMVAYEKALNTWAKWIDSNIDPTKTQVFFQGVSRSRLVHGAYGTIKKSRKPSPSRGGAGESSGSNGQRCLFTEDHRIITVEN